MKNILKGFAILLISVLLLELACLVLFKKLAGVAFDTKALSATRAQRLTVIDRRLKSDHVVKGLHVMHPYVGYVGRQGAWSLGTQYPPFNNFGMVTVKGHPYPYKKKKNDFVIANLGGSVASIFAIMAEDNLAMFLKQESKYLKDKNIVLLDLATGGYKQPQQLFHLQYALLSGFEIDAVINMDGFNDLVLAVSNMERDVNPLYPSSDHYGFIQRTVKDDFSPERIVILARIYTALETEKKILKFVDMFPFNKSPFFNMVNVRMAKKTKSDVKDAEYEFVAGSAKDLPKEVKGPKLNMSTGSPDEKYAGAAQIWARSSALLNSVCKGQGIDYFHFLQPNQYIVGSKPITKNERKVAYKPDNPWPIMVRSGYSRLIEQGKELNAAGIPYWDLTMIFKDNNDDLYYDSCCHFNEEGNKIAAQRMAEIIGPAIDRKYLK